MQDTKEHQPHDKGYKRIFSVKKNFLDFIKKYVGFDWMLDLTVDDIELVNKEYVTDQFDTYESDLVYKIRLRGMSEETVESDGSVVFVNRIFSQKTIENSVTFFFDMAPVHFRCHMFYFAISSKLVPFSFNVSLNR